jgi:hypothetical protein
VTSEQIEGPIPAGGAYAELIRVDGEVSRSSSTTRTVRAIARTYAGGGLAAPRGKPLPALAPLRPAPANRRRLLQLRR